MRERAAIVSTSFDPALIDALKAALQTDGIRCRVISEADKRLVMRQVMELDRKDFPLCIFCDDSARAVSTFVTALDPRVSAVAWCKDISQAEEFAEFLHDVPVLVTFAESPAMVAHLCRPIIEGDVPIPNAPLEAAQERPRILPKTEEHPPVTRPQVDDADLAVYQQLETMMASPVKEFPKPEPVQLQRPGLDFSTPLRKLMSHGRNLAQKTSAPEVLGIHYLAALEEPYRTRLEEAGLTRSLIDEYLGGFASAEQIAVDPIVSDEAFDAVSRAKGRARERNGQCIQTADFLAALLAQEEGSVADILADGALSNDALDNALEDLDEIIEPCPAPFFAPSSLDQDGFYEFDPAQVKTVEERLRSLPGFQKAAARVAETRKAQKPPGAAPEAPAVAAVANIAAEPPEKPEVIKVSAVFPSVDEVEHIADRLLEGQLIAFPADTMYALAADAANPAAIERLRQTADLPPEKPLSILINSTSQLKHLVRADLDSLEPLFDELWPGPLTLVFRAAGTIARHVSSGGTIAIRQPQDNTSLAILSMLGRPLAVTSWDATPADKPVDVAQLTDQLAGKAAIIVTHGEPVPQTSTTVVDTTTSPWQVLREGAVPAEDVLRHSKD